MDHIIIMKMFETLENSTEKRENHQCFPERTTANYNKWEIVLLFWKTHKLKPHLEVKVKRTYQA